VIGYTYIPRLKARIQHEGGGYIVKTNSTGFRSEFDFDASRRAGLKRVLVFGDSYTAGDGVSNTKRFSDVAAQQLEGVEILNFGLAGSGTDQQYLVYREFGSAVEHDLVVIATTAENIRRNMARFRVYLSEDNTRRVFAKPYFSLGSDQALNLHHIPVPKSGFELRDLPKEDSRFVDFGGRFNRLYRLLVKRNPGWIDVLQKYSRYQPCPQYKKRDSRGWQLMSGILRKWITESRVQVVLFPLPIPQYAERTADANHFQTRFQEFASEVGCGYYDILPKIWKMKRKDVRRMRFDIDSHFSVFGHEIYARNLVNAIDLNLEI
jgi:carbamoyltransferase